MFTIETSEIIKRLSVKKEEAKKSNIPEISIFIGLFQLTFKSNSLQVYINYFKNIGRTLKTLNFIQNLNLNEMIITSDNTRFKTYLKFTSVQLLSEKEIIKTESPVINQDKEYKVGRFGEVLKESQVKSNFVGFEIDFINAGEEAKNVIRFYFSEGNYKQGLMDNETINKYVNVFKKIFKKELIYKVDGNLISYKVNNIDTTEFWDKRQFDSLIKKQYRIYKTGKYSFSVSKFDYEKEYLQIFDSKRLALQAYKDSYPVINTKKKYAVYKKYSSSEKMFMTKYSIEFIHGASFHESKNYALDLMKTINEKNGFIEPIVNEIEVPVVSQVSKELNQLESYISALQELNRISPEILLNTLPVNLESKVPVKITNNDLVNFYYKNIGTLPGNEICYPPVLIQPLNLLEIDLVESVPTAIKETKNIKPVKELCFTASLKNQLNSFVLLIFLLLFAVTVPVNYIILLWQFLQLLKFLFKLKTQ